MVAAPGTFARGARGSLATHTQGTDIVVHPIASGDEPAWNALVEVHPRGTIFHTLGWRDVVYNTFHHQPFYLVARESKELSGVLPLFLVRSIFAGRMLVSVPYAVAGGILANSEGTRDALWRGALRLAESQDCKLIDLRSETADVPGVPVSDKYVGFSRVLPERKEDVLESLPRKARAAARNAREKFALTVSFRHTDLQAVWKLYCRNMRRLGSIAYPFGFFTAIRGCLRRQHWVSVVYRGDRPVASLVTLLFGDRVMPYLAGFTPEARQCSAANFLYLTLMEKAVESGYRVFDFGRSRRDNTGSMDFKRFQGFAPAPLEYQRWTGDGPAFDLSPSNPTFALARRIWPWLPLPVTQIVGKYLSRHIPG